MSPGSADLDDVQLQTWQYLQSAGIQAAAWVVALQGLGGAALRHNCAAAKTTGCSKHGMPKRATEDSQVVTVDTVSLHKQSPLPTAAGCLDDQINHKLCQSH
jgi:hypothetical protein